MAATSLPDVSAPNGTPIPLPTALGHDWTVAGYTGELLWQVLLDAGAARPDNPRAVPHRIVVVTGQDGYTAVLALGELSPEFEGKQAILARSRNGQPLPGGGLRLVVPGDAAQGRSVRDVAHVAVQDVATPAK